MGTGAGIGFFQQYAALPLGAGQAPAAAAFRQPFVHRLVCVQ